MYTMASTVIDLQWDLGWLLYLPKGYTVEDSEDVNIMQFYSVVLVSITHSI